MTPLVSIENLTVSFPLGRRLFGAPPTLKAVKNVSLNIPKGSFVGLVGESGSGKTTSGTRDPPRRPDQRRPCHL